MKKLFNYRPLVSMCLFAMAGIIFVSGFYLKTAFGYVMTALVAVCLVATVIVKAVKAKDHKLFKILSIIIAFACFSLITFANLAISENKDEYNGEYKVYGRVASDIYLSSKDRYVVNLDHVYLVKDEKTFKVDGNVILYLSISDGRCEDYSLGSTIISNATVSKPKLKNGGNQFYYLNKNVYLVGFGSEEGCNFVDENDRNIMQKYKLRVKDALDFYLSDEYSSLGYTILFGDKAGLDEDFAETYRASGLAHLLAVSGLHVGFIVTLISFILSLFKANDKVKFFVTIIITFLYAMLCGFTVSVTRAFIMTFVLLYFKMRKKESDGLSSLALAGLIILLIRPLSFYDAGFRLSFGAVLGIMLLSKQFTRFFMKAFSFRFSNALAISISAQIGTIPFIALYFKNISIFSIVANILAIPLASLAFMIMSLFVIFGVIWKPLGFGLYVFKWLMYIVTLIGKIMGSITFAGANQIMTTVFSFMLIATIMLATDYTFYSRKLKIVFSSCGAVLSATCFVLMFVLWFNFTLKFLYAKISCEGEKVKFVELKKDLQTRIRPAYLISGNDRFLCYSALEQIKSALNISMPELNFVIMDSNLVSIQDIVESASVFPFIDKYRAIQINNFNIKNKAKEDKLLNYLKNPMNETVLIFFNLDQTEALKPYLSLITPVDCDKLSLETLISTLKAKFEKSGAKIGREALETLVLFCNNDMARISGESEKLISYASGSEITTDMVKKLVVEDKEYQVFELAEFIAKNDKFKALDLVETLSNDKKGGFSILTPLYNNYRRVLYVAINKDKTDSELATLLGVKEYAIKMVKNQARVFSPRSLKKIVDMLYEMDRNIKMGKIKEDTAMYSAVLNILNIRG